MSPKGLYEFGPFRLDRGKHLLLRDRKPLKMPPKAFDILVLLVEKRGTLMTKSELLNAVWPDTFVEENNLTQYVSMLRKTLSDSAEGQKDEQKDDQKYIQTVPKLGYRFVPDVREIEDGESELLIAKHTHTRIVMREEEEEDGEIAGEIVPVAGRSEEMTAASMASGIAIREASRRARSASRTVKIIAISAVTLAVALAAILITVAVRSHRDADRTPGHESIVAPVKPRYS